MDFIVDQILKWISRCHAVFSTAPVRGHGLSVSWRGNYLIGNYLDGQHLDTGGLNVHSNVRSKAVKASKSVQVFSCLIT